jgi:predicted ArsR family transcriptional regulator
MTMERPDPALEVLDSAVRRRMLDLLSEAGPSGEGWTAGQLGDHLGLHVTSARFHLNVLERAGLVESGFQRQGVGRPRKVYRCGTRHSSDGPRTDEALRALTGFLTEGDGQPGLDRTPEQAGRVWALAQVRAEDAAHAAGDLTGPRTVGSWLAKVGRTVDLLHRWGYRPELRTEEGGRTVELLLSDSPFLGLAKTHPGAVCAVHRGLIRGALEAAGEPDVEVTVQPFGEPGACWARVRARTPFQEVPRFGSTTT